MRKRIAERSRTQISEPEQGWLDLQEIATLEITSEDPNFPIDSVFTLNPGPGWRASQRGEQHIRIIFDQPISVRRIQLHFLEPELERTQEFHSSVVVSGRWNAERDRPPAMEFQSRRLDP